MNQIARETRREGQKNKMKVRNKNGILHVWEF